MHNDNESVNVLFIQLYFNIIHCIFLLNSINVTKQCSIKKVLGIFHRLVIVLGNSLQTANVRLCRKMQSQITQWIPDAKQNILLMFYLSTHIHRSESKYWNCLFLCFVGFYLVKYANKSWMKFKYSANAQISLLIFKFHLCFSVTHFIYKPKEIQRSTFQYFDPPYLTRVYCL